MAPPRGWIHACMCILSARALLRCALPLARQVTTREHKARPGLEAVVDKIQRVLEGVCREVQRQARLYQESVRDQAELQVGEDGRWERG